MGTQKRLETTLNRASGLVALVVIAPFLLAATVVWPEVGVPLGVVWVGLALVAREG